jgi:hypothetical protein
MAHEWEIKSRAEKCAATGRAFQDGEFFYTLLFHDREGFRREDLSEEAWKNRNDNIQPFSFWRSKFEPPPAAPPEPLARESAEDLLRRYMKDDSPAQANTRYILGVMLERKRILKQIDTTETDSGRTLVYEHVKTGEVFLIPDPQLRMDQIESVQNEVAALLK